MISTSEVPSKKQFADEITQSEARFRAIFEDAALGIGILGLDRRLIDANPALCRMYGLTRDELIGHTPEIVTHPDDYSQSTNDFQLFLSGKIDYYQGERRYLRKGGNPFWAHVTMSFVRDIDNKPLYIVGIVIDIDDRKRAQLDLHISEERFRAIFDNTAIGMTLSTLDRHVIQMNEALTRITGYSLEELQALHPTDLAHPQDRHLGRQEFADLLAGKRKVFSVEQRYFHKSGRIFWGRATYSLVYDADGQPCSLVGLMEDITEAKLAAEKLATQETEYRQMLEQKIAERTLELRQINQRLEEEIFQRQKAEQALADKAAQDAIRSERTRLARDLHDAVTQTLFSSSLIAEVLPDLWEINPEEGEKRLEELRQLTRGALAEMRTLLIELRPDSLVKIPLPDLLRQLCESLIGRARLPIQFSPEGQSKIPPDVQIALYRITQEALNNIVKHAKATQVNVSLQMGSTVRLRIVDDGCGFNLASISPDHLGLKIMCERGESIGARCSIYSQPGEGTHISVIWQSENEKDPG
jgi:PAS domain S-box-containing protein